MEKIVLVKDEILRSTLTSFLNRLYLRYIKSELSAPSIEILNSDISNSFIKSFKYDSKTFVITKDEKGRKAFSELGSTDISYMYFAGLNLIRDKINVAHGCYDVDDEYFYLDDTLSFLKSFKLSDTYFFEEQVRVTLIALIDINVTLKYLLYQEDTNNRHDPSVKVPYQTILYQSYILLLSKLFNLSNTLDNTDGIDKDIWYITRMPNYEFEIKSISKLKKISSEIDNILEQLNYRQIRREFCTTNLIPMEIINANEFD